MEHRSRFGRLRAANVQGKPGVTLHAITPGVVDDFGSLWAASTFDESLRERLPTLCWSHDWSEPLGPGVGFRVGTNGPDVDFAFSDFDAVPTARRAYAQIKDGTVRDCSVGFSDARRRDPTPDEVHKYPGIREVIEKATLDEISLVMSGAVPGAVVADIRRRDAAQFRNDLDEELEARAALELVDRRMREWESEKRVKRAMRGRR